ncbi:MAG: transcriptional regulator [Chloroflexi bacterium]|nr:MAG: transcriptional regulator [Chloroflexota bacterium]
MNSKRRKELEAKGWKFGGVEDFLGLTDEELEYIEVKITLSEMVKDYRERNGLTQIAAAKILESSQSRLSKIETADPTVSIDLQIKSLLALGATKEDIGQKIAC